MCDIYCLTFFYFIKYIKILIMKNLIFYFPEIKDYYAFTFKCYFKIFYTYLSMFSYIKIIRKKIDLNSIDINEWIIFFQPNIMDCSDFKNIILIETDPNIVTDPNYYNNIKLIVSYRYKNIINHKNLNFNKIVYIPLISNNIYEKEKLRNVEKDIDILFYGRFTKHRQRIYKQFLRNDDFKNKKIVWKECINDNELVNYIQRSKIVLVIFINWEQATLDTFRINLLINLKAFFIHEMIDLNLLPDNTLKKLIVFSNYNRIINKCLKYLNMSQNRINDRCEKLYQHIKKKYTMNKLFPKKLLNDEK